MSKEREKEYEQGKRERIWARKERTAIEQGKRETKTSKWREKLKWAREERKENEQEKKEAKNQEKYLCIPARRKMIFLLILSESKNQKPHTNESRTPIN